ncbi:unnamed protein product [Ilex paraguariensis]|uniref:RING-type E3 ubiquitin transferase n=1 Tax=Ilex paraguariensis TaxID=185542 RepID=A0ABC8UTS4_9AQUA
MSRARANFRAVTVDLETRESLARIVASLRNSGTILSAIDQRIDTILRELGTVTASTEPASFRAAGGVDSVLRGLREVMVEEEDGHVCGVCLDEMKRGDEAIAMGCMHKFHGYCIVKWLKRKTICPLCRARANFRAVSVDLETRESLARIVASLRNSGTILSAIDQRIDTILRELGTVTASTEPASFRAAGGVDSVLRGLREVMVEEEDGHVCGVCLDEMKRGDEAIAMGCMHKFHGYCIVKWLKRKTICPLCRYKND